MQIELDEWDKDFLARWHPPEEYRRELQAAMERCAAYSARIAALEAELAELRGRRMGCAYPGCLDGGGRCARMWAGECAGPREVKP